MATGTPTADDLDPSESISPELVLVDSKLSELARRELPDHPWQEPPFAADPLRKEKLRERDEGTGVVGVAEEQPAGRPDSRVRRRPLALLAVLGLVVGALSVAVALAGRGGPPGPNLAAQKEARATAVPPLPRPAPPKPKTGTEPRFRPRTTMIGRGSIAGVRLGDSASRVRALWGPPARILAFPEDEDLDPSIRKLEWRYGEGREAYVAIRDDRVVEVKADLEGTGLRTRLGDGAGTRESVFRARWSQARRRVTAEAGRLEAHYYLAAARPGFVVVFSFLPRTGLGSIALMSRSTFLGPRSLWLR
jgi:hypothetical protein